MTNQSFGNLGDLNQEMNLSKSILIWVFWVVSRNDEFRYPGTACIIAWNFLFEG